MQALHLTGARMATRGLHFHGCFGGFMQRFKFLLAFTLLCSMSAAQAADYPAPVEGEFVLRDFGFSKGQSLPALKIHYRTLGSPKKDAKGVVRNAVLIGHGTGGSGAQFIRPEFAGELFGAGQPLDATQFFIVL